MHWVIVFYPILEGLNIIIISSNNYVVQCFSLTVDTCDISLNGSYVTKTSVSIGDSVVLQCTCLNGTVQWRFNGEDITTNTHYNIDVTNDTLTIPAVRSSDNGNYSCNSHNVSLTVTGT